MESRVLYKKPTKKTSERMKKIKSSGSKMEREMESLLKKLNASYEKQPKLLGHPDFRIKGTKFLVFCDSAFWHGKRKNDLDGTAFKKNKKFWMQKLQCNKARDERNNRVLRKQGWSVQRFSDADILKKQEKVLRRLRRIIDGIQI